MSSPGAPGLRRFRGCERAHCLAPFVIKFLTKVAGFPLISRDFRPGRGFPNRTENLRKANTYNYLGLVRELTFTDFKLKYQGSFFGYLWSLGKPLMIFGVLLVVFTNFLKLGNSVPNYPVYLLLGIVLWTYFVEATFSSMGSIVSKGELIRKVYFPRIILPISSSVTALLTLGLNLIIVFLFMFFSKISLSVEAPLVVLLLLEFFVFTAGVSLFLASLFVRFRDVLHTWEVGTQALFYATPILYPLNLVPEKWGMVLMLSPIAQIIQDCRHVLITPESQTAMEILPFPLSLVPYLLPILLFATGYWFFQKQASKFAEEI